MNWTSASDFFAMGGYASYVWGSFGVVAFAFIAEAWTVARRRKDVVARLRRQVMAERIDKESH